MRCEDLRVALASGEARGPEVEDHLAGCPRCREAESVVRLAEASASPVPIASPPPSLPWIKAEAGRRRAVRGAVAVAAGLLVSAMAVGWLSERAGSPQDRPDPDLLGVVASLEDTLWDGAASDLPGAEGLALLDPYGDDWAPPYEPLTDALLGAGEL